MHTCRYDADTSGGLNLNELPRTRSWHIQGCSAKTGENLQDGMEWLVQMIGGDGSGAAASGGAEEKSGN